MSEPATNVRLDVVRWLVARLRQAMPDGVQVEPGWPGDNIRREAVWVDEIAGDQTQPVMVAGRRQRDDRFRIPLEIRVQHPSSLDDASERLSILMAVIEDVLADAHTLDDEVPGVLSAEIATERSLVGRTPAGLRGFGRVELAIHTRLA